MPVNKEELAKDLETPEYLELVKTKLTEKKFVVRDEAAETTFQDNFKQSVIEKEIGPKISEVHSLYDKDVKELFGVDRNQDEKSYDYLRRAAKGKLSAHEKTISDLNEAIKKGDPTGALASKLEAAEKQYQATLKEKDDMITKLKGDSEVSNKNSKLMEAYTGVKSKFIKTLPAFFAKTEKVLLDGILTGAVLGPDGKLYKGDGTGGIAKDKGFNPIPIEAVLLEEFKDVIDEKKPQGGAGSGSGSGAPSPGSGVDPKTITKDNFEMPAGIKSQNDLMTHMIELGMDRGSDAFKEIWKERTKDLPLT